MTLSALGCRVERRKHIVTSPGYPPSRRGMTAVFTPILVDETSSELGNEREGPCRREKSFYTFHVSRFEIRRFLY